MANKESRKVMVRPQRGTMRDFVTRLKLIVRLMGDRRVSSFLKLLPLASVAYLIWPFDLVPGIALPFIGMLDDAAILWIGSTLFVELCPPNLVKEHMRELESNMDDAFGEVVDVEATDMSDDKR